MSSRKITQRPVETMKLRQVGSHRGCSFSDDCEFGRHICAAYCECGHSTEPTCKHNQLKSTCRKCYFASLVHYLCNHGRDRRTCNLDRGEPDPDCECGHIPRRICGHIFPVESCSDCSSIKPHRCKYNLDRRVTEL